MKQYCRYCVHCAVGNGNWCDVRQKSYSDAYFKRVNNCKDFSFCNLDVFDISHEYKPRNKSSGAVEQVSLFERKEE